ncbi:MAG: hypothetical protein AAFY20_04685 [Cyanobacteria bacterium J06639_14]
MTSQKFLFRGMMGLICVEIGLALAYLTLVVKQGGATPLLDFNGLRSLPSLLQAAHLFALGGLSLLLLFLRRRMTHPISWFLPSALVLLCFYGGLDEVTKLHLHLKQFDWHLIYLGILIGIPLIGWRDFIVLWRYHRSTVQWVLAGLGIFLLGGFGTEIMKGAIASEVSTYSSSARLLFLTEHLRITVEEFAELCGETLILYAFARFAHQTAITQSRVST